MRIIRRTLIGMLFIFGMALASMPMAVAQTGVNATDGVAIKGHDPVAYFSEGRPVEGSAAFAHRWNDATWHFASAANRDRFAADPTAYAPQYGGFCAYGLTKGYKAPIDPTAWRVVDGKLYLNYSKSVQQSWLADIAGHVRQADANWVKLGAR